MKRPISSFTIHAGPQYLTTEKLMDMDADAGGPAEIKHTANVNNAECDHEKIATATPLLEFSEAFGLASDDFRNSPNGGRVGNQYDSEPTHYRQHKPEPNTMNHINDTTIENQQRLSTNLDILDSTGNGTLDETSEVLLEDETDIEPADTLHSKSLPQFGITAEALAAVKANKSSRSSGRTSLHWTAIRNAAPELIAQTGAKMLTARRVFDYLKSNDQCKSATGQPLEFANFIGDSMGKGGLNLPRLRKGGKLVYAMEFVNATDQEKAAGQEQLNNLSADQKKAMKTA